MGFMKSNVCVTLLNMLHKIYSKFTVYINELILTPFSPFDIKCKKINLMWKTSGNAFLGYLGQIFSDFPKVALDHGGCPQFLLELSWMLQYSVQVLYSI